MSDERKVEKLVKDEAAIEEALESIIDIEADALKKAEGKKNS